MKKNSGNALWFILLAIFLLGGLTVLLSRTGGNTEETGNNEKESIVAAELLRYASSLKTGVDQLRAKGCSENDISFWRDTNNDGIENASDAYYNPTAPTDRSCHIFSENGAGLTFKTSLNFFPKGDWTGGVAYNHFAGRSAFLDVGTSNPELYWIFELPNNINPAAFCVRLNKLLGHSVTTPPLVGIWASPAFTGTFSAPVGVGTAAMSGKNAYCTSYSSAPARHHVYQILIRR